MTRTTPTFDVHLAVNDIFRGMAPCVIDQTTGFEHAVDIFSHTALLGHGPEYSFGNGIVQQEPNEF